MYSIYPYMKSIVASVRISILEQFKTITFLYWAFHCDTLQNGLYKGKKNMFPKYVNGKTSHIDHRMTEQSFPIMKSTSQKTIYCIYSVYYDVFTVTVGSLFERALWVLC